MQGQVRYELQDDNPHEALLHCYIPKDVQARDVDLSYEVDGISKGTIAIHFDSQTKGKLGCVQLPGYVFPPDIEAKFSKKHSRYTFRLIRASKGDSSTDDERITNMDQGVDSPDEFKDAASTAPSTPSTVAAPAVEAADRLQDSTQEQQQTQAQQHKELLLHPETTANGQHHTDTEQLDSPQQDSTADTESMFVDVDVDVDAVAEAATDSSPHASRADVQQQQQQQPLLQEQQPQQDEAEAEDDDEDQDQEGATADGETAVKTAKKRRGAKKKKKKTKSKSSEAAADAGASTAITAVDSSSPAGADTGEPEEEFLDAISDGADDVLAVDTTEQQAASSGSQPQQQQQLSPSPKSRQQPSRPSSAVAPIVFDSNNYMSHFAEEPVAGRTAFAPSPEEPLLLPETLLHGPTVHSCLDKHDVKGEDKGLNLKGCSWTPAGSSVSTSFSAFGIFDGHGGKPAATYASKELLPVVMRLVDRCIDGSGSDAVPSRQGSAAVAPDATGEKAEDEETWGVEVTDDDRAIWAAQEALVERLPKAMFAGFLEADKICRQRHRVSGTTATLAVVVGWELIVASVGDSAAYLDTGKEVIAVSGNHRIDENPQERARIIAAGGEVSKSSIDGKPAGPDRVWPGGLAMSRTIGDPQAPQVIAVPDIRHITLPTTGGRLVIASDGVWDHMQPKSMIHQVRNQTTDAAAKKIAASALKKKGLRDDISVLVVDLVPSASDPRPPALLQTANRDAVEACQVMRPLSEVELEAALATIENRGAEGSELLQQQLQTAASVTAVTAAVNSTWRANAAARRDSALLLLRLSKQREAEAAAAEAARLADLAAKAAAEAQGAGLSDTYRELAALKLDVNVVVAEVQEQQQKQQQQAEQEQQQDTPPAAAAADDEGWVTVGGSSSSGTAANGYVSFEQQLRSEAGAVQPRQQQYRGRGRGRGAAGRREASYEEQQQQQGGDAVSTAAAEVSRDGNAYTARGRGGRGRGRGRKEFSLSNEHYNHQQQQQHDAAAAAGEGDNNVELVHEYSRGGRGRGRGRRAFRNENYNQQQQQHGDDIADTAAAAADMHEGGRGGRGRGRGRRDMNGKSNSREYHAYDQQQQQPASEQQQEAGSACDAGITSATYEEQQQQQQGSYRGRGLMGARGGRSGRGGGGFDAHQQREWQPVHKQQQQQVEPDSSATASEQQREYYGGRGRGARRGRGGRGEQAQQRHSESQPAQHAADHADVSHSTSGFDQQEQQQQQQPRQQYHAANGAVDAGAGAPDAAVEAAPAAAKKPAVRVVPRSGKPYGGSSNVTTAAADSSDPAAAAGHDAADKHTDSSDKNAAGHSGGRGYGGGYRGSYRDGRGGDHHQGGGYGGYRGRGGGGFRGGYNSGRGRGRAANNQAEYHQAQPQQAA